MLPIAIQKRAGHASFATTQQYIDQAGIEFPEESAKLAERLWGASSTKNRYEVPAEPAHDEKQVA